MKIRQTQYFLLLNLKRQIKKLHVKYGDIQIKEHSKGNYLGYLLDETMSGEAWHLKLSIKLTASLNFFIVKLVFWWQH